MTFEYKLDRSVQNWCRESDTPKHLKKILLKNSQLLDVHKVHKRKVSRGQIEYVYHYRLSDRGYTLLSLTPMIRTLKLLTDLAEWPNRK